MTDHAFVRPAVWQVALATLMMLTPPAQADPPVYPNHHNLMQLVSRDGHVQPIRSLAGWRARRRHVLESFQQATGPLPQPSRRVPLDVRIHETTAVDGLTRLKLTYQADKTGRVAAYLFLPRRTVPPRRLPAVLCLQQTQRLGKLEPAGLAGNGELAHALHLAKRGYVTLAPDYPGFGDSQYDFTARHGYQSGTMKAIWNNIRAVDLLATLKTVDPQRIGVIGHSLGGHNAIFTAVFESRLRVVVTNSGFSTFQKDDVPSWTGPRYMPLIRTRYGNDPNRVPFDFPELLGAIAPRALLVIAPKRDRDFDYSGVLDAVDAARPVFQLHGAGASLQVRFPDISHSFPASSRREADRFLDRHLADESAP